MKPIGIRGEFITLGQFLKFAGIAETGGDARAMLDDGEVQVNGDSENRRGRKLYPDDVVVVFGDEFVVTREDR
ncbi:MAG: RNA-binding S4 domain-containing protein [Armatimonadota bacterium]|nr:RNA-binding S4 domain-containing protein [Armatimonadota bacterium]